MSAHPSSFLESQTGSHRLGMSSLWGFLHCTHHLGLPASVRPAPTSSGLASSPGMDPSRKYPVWYKNIVSLWILFGMAWQALIIKMILSLLEMPGDMCTCPLRCIKSRSWRQGQEGQRRVQSPNITSGTFHSGYAV